MATRPNILRTGKFSDSKVITLFKEIVSRYGHAGSSIVLGQNFSFQLKEIDENLFANDLTTAIIAADITTAEPRFHIAIRRGTGSDATNIDGQRSASPYFDELALSIPGTDRNDPTWPTAQQLVECTQLLQSYIHISIPAGSSDPANSAADLLQSELEHLNSIFRKMIKEQDKFRKDQESSLAKRLEEVEHTHQKNLEDLNNKKIEQDALIKAEKEKLEEIRAQLDDRDNTHVRRDLRAKINSEVNDLLKSSTSMNKTSLTTRLGVTGLSMVAVIVLAMFSFQSFDHINVFETLDSTQQPPDFIFWSYFTRGTLASIGSVAFIIYTIGWLRKIYQDDIRQIRNLERYGLDINRASWAVETIMDMKTTQGQTPPSTWIEGVCRTLFNDGSATKDQETAALEAMATLLNVSGKAKFGPEGPEFELSRKGRKEIVDAVEERLN